jgi:hypothetical protein
MIEQRCAPQVGETGRSVRPAELVRWSSTPERNRRCVAGSPRLRPSAPPSAAPFTAPIGALTYVEQVCGAAKYRIAAHVPALASVASQDGARQGRSVHPRIPVRTRRRS